MIVTADHSHSFVLYGKAKRGNPILGFQSRTPPDGLPALTLAYANGPGGLKPNRSRADLTGVDYNATDFRQQALISTSSESHGGEDVGMCNIALFHCFLSDLVKTKATKPGKRHLITVIR
jgi:alkaline phosphatase